jgi:hypothetical protein
LNSLNVIDQYKNKKDLKLNSSSIFDPTPDTSVLYKTVIPQLSLTEYDSYKEFIDNCIDAGAKNILIEIDKGHRIIYDDAKGMNQSQLQGALTFAKGSTHISGDLGKFSIGGTTASCTLGSKRKIITRNNSGLTLTGIQDINNIAQTKIDKSNNIDIDILNRFTSKTGTAIIISDLRTDKIKYPSQIKRYLEDLSLDLGKTYFKKLHSINIEIKCGKDSIKVRPIDPLKEDLNIENLIKSKKCEVIDFKNSKIFIRKVYFDLNKLGKKDEKGLHDQGVYYLRNDRIISSAQVNLDLWGRRHNMKNAARIEVSFSEDLDGHFSVCATKNKVSLSSEVTKILTSPIKTWVDWVQGEERKNNKTKPSNTSVENSINSFRNKLEKNSDIINLPKDKNIISSEKEKRKSPTNKTGAVEPKNSGSKRRNFVAKLPNFIFTNQPRDPAPYFIDFEEGEMVITINQGHKFVEFFYEKGNDLSREMFELFATANCYAEYRKKDSRSETAINAYLEDSFQELKTLMNMY